MTIGTPTLIANNTTGAADTLVTDGGDIAIGSSVVAFCSTLDFDDQVTGLSDGTANVYVLSAQNPANAGNCPCAFFVCAKTVADIPNGTTFTGTSTNSGQCFVGIILSIAGATGGVGASVVTNGTGTSVSLASGTLAQPSQIILGLYNPITDFVGHSESGGFTAIGGSIPDGFDPIYYQIVDTTAGATLDLSWTNSQAYTAALISLIATTATDALMPQACL